MQRLFQVLNHRTWAAGLVALAMASGCNFVPKARLEDGRKVAQTLRAENVRLKDQTLDLRTKNQDLVQRAQDDARRLSIQDEAVARLERSVTAYQAERDQLANAFESFKRQARLTSTGKDGPSADSGDAPNPSNEPLELFANQHPDWTFDRQAKTLSIPLGRLFAPGALALKPESKGEVEAVGEAFAKASKSATEPFALEIEAAGEASDVHQAVFRADDDTEVEVSRRFSGASRAARVRESLLEPADLDPALVRIAPPKDDHADLPAVDPRVVIRLVPAERSKSWKPPGLDSKPN